MTKTTSINRCKAKKGLAKVRQTTSKSWATSFSLHLCLPLKLAYFSIIINSSTYRIHINKDKLPLLTFLVLLIYYYQGDQRTRFRQNGSPELLRGACCGIVISCCCSCKKYCSPPPTRSLSPLYVLYLFFYLSGTHTHTCMQEL